MKFLYVERKNYTKRTIVFCSTVDVKQPTGTGTKVAITFAVAAPKTDSHVAAVARAFGDPRPPPTIKRFQKPKGA